MAEIQTFGHNDIQRYLQQKMSPQEMHNFEKALMDDPFLADAMEGFSASDPELTATHLAAIETELTGQKEHAKVVVLPKHKAVWWKVAAVVVVIVSSGVLTYSLLNSGTAEREVARQHPATVSAEANKLAQPRDSIGPAEKTLAKANVFPQKRLESTEAAGSPIIDPVPQSIAPGATIAQSTEIAMAEQGARGAATSKKDEDTVSTPGSRQGGDADISSTTASTTMSAPQAEHEFKGKVIGQDGQPVQSATIRARNSGMAAISDPNGNFTLKAPDTPLLVSANSPGYNPIEKVIKSNTSNNQIVLEENSKSLSDVVITGYSSKKARSAKRENNTRTTAEPEGGWDRFEQYINRHVDSLKTSSSSEYYNGPLELEFSIDKQGRPANIKALDKANKIAAETATEILSKGPRWKNNKKLEKVKVVIPF